MVIAADVCDFAESYFHGCWTLDCWTYDYWTLDRLLDVGLLDIGSPIVQCPTSTVQLSHGSILAIRTCGFHFKCGGRLVFAVAIAGRSAAGAAFCAVSRGAAFEREQFA